MHAIQAVFVISLLALCFATGKHGNRKFNSCRQAYLECDWEFNGFRGKIPTFSAHTKPDQACTPIIVSKNPKEKIGILNTNGIVPEFILGRRAVPITNFGQPRFTPTHFKPFAIDHTLGSGIAHQTFHGNQKRIARGQCVRVFFTTYQKLAHGRPLVVVEIINVKRHDNKCVVFRLH